MANEVIFSEYGFFNEVFPLDQLNWAKVFHPYVPDGIVPGIDNELGVYANSSGMKVYVKSGECRVRSHRGALTETIELEISEADTTNPRIDLVVAMVIYGDAPNSKMKVGVITGTPSSSPVAPTVTQVAGGIWELALAEVRVEAGATSIGSDKVLERKQYSVVGGGADPMEIFYFGGG